LDADGRAVLERIEMKKNFQTYRYGVSPGYPIE
jgi:hypothetical protein